MKLTEILRFPISYLTRVVVILVVAQDCKSTKKADFAVNYSLIWQCSICITLKKCYPRFRHKILLVMFSGNTLKVFVTVLYSQIVTESSTSKRIHVTTGSTPHKPVEKRSREVRSAIRKPLDFSDVENSENNSTSPRVKVSNNEHSHMMQHD